MATHVPGRDDRIADAQALSAVRLEPWGEDDHAFLAKRMGDSAMMRYLGGPEPAEQTVQRHAKYLDLTESGRGRMLRIVDAATGESVGSIGYWDKSWDGGSVYEMGWAVLPPFQRRGIALAAGRLAISQARSERRHRFLHAFPSTENLPSNNLCPKLGFSLVGECEFEYPKGTLMRSFDWRIDLLGADTK